MKNSTKTGKRFSEAEAIDILTQCRAIRESLDALEKKANLSLMYPEPKLVGTHEDKVVEKSNN